MISPLLMFNIGDVSFISIDVRGVVQPLSDGLTRGAYILTPGGGKECRHLGSLAGVEIVQNIGAVFGLFSYFRPGGRSLPFLQTGRIDNPYPGLCPFGISGQVVGASCGHSGGDVQRIWKLKAVQGAEVGSPVGNALVDG